MTAAPVPAPSELVPRPEQGRIFEGARRVRLADVSPAGRLRLDAVARYLQDVSADDTADAALPDAQAWVVRKTVLEVRASPRYLEPLRLATWCSGTGSHWAERRVEVIGDDGGRIDAASTWVHFDTDSGRPARLGPSFDAIYGEACGGRRVKARLEHPDVPAGAARSPWMLRFTDFDVLDHVNNAAYWEIVEEVLTEHRDLRAPVRAELEHKAAIERGATVEVASVPADGGVDVWVLADGAVAASAQVRRLAG